MATHYPLQIINCAFRMAIDYSRSCLHVNRMTNYCRSMDSLCGRIKYNNNASVVNEPKEKLSSPAERIM